jgi:phospholipase/carboxylesterase
MATPPAKPTPYSDGRLHARPGPPSALTPLPAGSRTIAFPQGRSALFFAPPLPAEPAPLLLLLHGAGGQHGGADQLALAHAAKVGAYLLVPSALSSSWDILRGGFGPDLEFLDRLLRWTFRHYAIAPAAISIGGFSDGASYALSIGLMNGDLFRDIVAFSPGFARTSMRVGQPRIFIAHGQHDPVLPVACGQALYHQLSVEGYDVQYEEFDGPHIVSPPLAGLALGRAMRNG